MAIASMPALMARELSPVAPSDTPDKQEYLDILLVEDDYSDAILTQRALQMTNMPFRLRALKRGEEALKALVTGIKSTPSTMPDVILLDLGLPGMDGFELLEQLARTKPAIRAIPIIVLTAHRHFDYLRHNYCLCISGYVTKPCDPGLIGSLLAAIKKQKDA